MSHCHHLQMVVVHNVTQPSSSDGCGAQCRTAIIFRWFVVHNVTQPSSSDGCGAQCYTAIIFNWLWCTMLHSHHLRMVVVHNVTQPSSLDGCGAQCRTAIIFRLLWCTMLHSHYLQLAVVHNVTQPSSSDLRKGDTCPLVFQSMLLELFLARLLILIKKGGLLQLKFEYSRHIISLRHVCYYQSTQTDVIDLTDFQKNDVLVDFSVIVGNHNNLG